MAKAAAKRDLLIETALALFNRDGIHATGIDTILAKAGIAKMTLYNHFKSKDELVLACLRRADEKTRNGFMRQIEQRAGAPRERLLTLFDVLADWFRGADFHGCNFVNACAEYTQPSDPIHRAAAEHKQLMFDYIAHLATAAGAPDGTLAERLALLVEGAIAIAHVSGDKGSAARAKCAAAVLIDAALGPVPFRAG
ncbi:MAG: TetR/AcrR family transcriptional regulator [Alphaproteobacteria bacterium]